MNNKNNNFFNELQYGIRGDFNHILKKSIGFKNNFYGNFIKKCYFKIIDTNFIVKTKIDKKIKKIFINEKI